MMFLAQLAYLAAFVAGFVFLGFIGGLVAISILTAALFVFFPQR
jgi:hypothetical protein